MSTCSGSKSSVAEAILFYKHRQKTGPAVKVGFVFKPDDDKVSIIRKLPLNNLSSNVLYVNSHSYSTLLGLFMVRI